MADVRIQNSELRWCYLNSEFCILTSAIFAYYPMLGIPMLGILLTRALAA
jgi:hypothetical protein